MKRSTQSAADLPHQTLSDVSLFVFSFQACLWRCERGPLFPCPLPKSKSRFGLHVSDLVFPQTITNKTSVFAHLQASRLIVTFDEHVISNNFKFGVIYQKFGQVSNRESKHPLRSLPGCWNGPLSEKKIKPLWFVISWARSAALLTYSAPSPGEASNTRSPLLKQSQPCWAQRRKLKSPWMALPPTFCL